MTAPITHDPSAHRFEATVEGLAAFLEYEERGDVLTFTHTYVPEPLRGRNLAAELTAAAFAHARAHRRRVLPACSYAAAYVKKHPEYADLVEPADR